VLGNHLHVILRLIDAASEGWWDGETVRRWGKLFPPRGKDRQALEVTYVWVEFRLKDAKWIKSQIEPPTLTGVWGNDIVRPSKCQRFPVRG